jgi:hypothetical protein
MTKQQIHIYKYFQVHIVIFHQDVLATLATIISMSSNKNIINKSTEFILQKCLIKLFNIIANFPMLIFRS